MLNLMHINFTGDWERYRNSTFLFESTNQKQNIIELLNRYSLLDISGYAESKWHILPTVSDFGEVLQEEKSSKYEFKLLLKPSCLACLKESSGKSSS